MTLTMTLTRDQILARRAALHREEVEVPDLGGSVFVRVMTLREVEQIKAIQKTSGGDGLRMYAKIAELTCVDETGAPLFVGEDVKLLNELPYGALDTITRAALRINRMTDDPKES